jgi:CubicO group peptidase (beta-lactamase class C family)
VPVDCARNLGARGGSPADAVRLSTHPPAIAMSFSRRSRFVLGFALAALWAAGAAAAPLPRGTPESQGVSSAALLDLVEEAERKIDALHSLMIVRGGHVIAEGWWAPYAAEEPHLLYSLSKSFTSTAVGLAVEAGRLSVDDPVLKFFPAAAPEKPSANLRAMRVKDLLTMSTGQHAEDIQGFPYNDPDGAAKKFLSLPVAHKPGTLFVYNSPATFMQSAIMQKVTGQSVLDYLGPRLFEPLGIASPTWEANREGISMGGFGLSLRTEDIAKFGQLYLQRGQWQGKQLVPASWVDTATARWVSNGSNPASDWEQGYGFQFWRCRHGAVRGDGAHGQFCLILREQDTVVAITAGTRNLQGVLDTLWPKLLPALAAKTPRPADPAAHAKLRAKLGALTLARPVAAVTPATGLAKAGTGARYVFPKNPLQVESLALAAAADDPEATEVTVTVDGKEETFAVSGRDWLRGEATAGPNAGLVALSGAWTAADTFTLDVVRYRTPFATRYRMVFGADSVTLEVKPNVGATPPAITGKRG